MRRRAIPIVALLTGALLGAGCAENAILELDLVAPPSSAAETVLNVQLLSTEEAVAAPENLGSPVQRFVLDAEPTQISVVASGDDIARPLYVGVWTCADMACAAADDPQAPTRLFRLERAFYLGQYTHLDLDLRREPLTGVVEISRCRVQGCGVADGDYCYADPDGTARHFCER